MIIDFLNKLNEINEGIFEGFDGWIESLPMADWLADAIIDSFHILPLLFLVFLLIEVVEFFWADDINAFLKKSERTAPLIGSLAAIIPQCGFSVIASTLYIRKFITKGTLIAIYLATSDEAIPILLSEPKQIHYVLPIIGVKIVIGIIAGYLVDYILKDNKYIVISPKHEHNCESYDCSKDKGGCSGNK